MRYNCMSFNTHAEAVNWLNQQPKNMFEFELITITVVVISPYLHQTTVWFKEA